MRGNVSLENNGGFVQIALDLAPGGDAVDASAWRGLELDVFGNGEDYGVHLRTDDLNRPWQSYRQTFRAEHRWQTVQFRFQSPNFPRLFELPRMDLDQHAKSLKTLEDNQRWLNEHELQTVHRGDLPFTEQAGTALPEPGMRDQQQ